MTEVGPTGKYFTQFDVPLPLDFVKVRNNAYEKGTQTGYECMSLSKYHQMVRKDLQVSEDIIIRSTQFCHDLGDILYYPQHEVVFLRPSFLVDLFKLVIRHDHEEATNWKTNMLSIYDITEDNFNQWKRRLLEKGELVLKLLDVLWSPLLGSLTQNSPLKEHLMELLETFDIALLIKGVDEKIVSIPEFQPKNLDQENFNMGIEKGQYISQRWISVDKSLPRCILKRIQVHVLKNIYKTSGTIPFVKLAQDEFYINDKSATTLYFKLEKATEVSPTDDKSEGIRYFIQSETREQIKDLLEKVNESVDDVLNEYTGLIFQTFAMHTSQRGTAFYKMKLLKTLKNKKQSKACVTFIKDGEKDPGVKLDVDDLGLTKHVNI